MIDYNLHVSVNFANISEFHEISLSGFELKFDKEPDRKIFLFYLLIGLHVSNGYKTKNSTFSK